ncbi:MAG TPA: OmpA family protein [Cellvibrio sp.]|nr:OmpA family protein [Cellvibrio sp.]
MKYTHKLALSAVIAAAISSGASADNHKVEIHADAGRVFFEDPLKDANIWDFGVGFALDENWMIDLVASQWDSETEPGAVDVDGTQYRADLLYHINTESAWRPYVAFGVGDQEREFNTAGAESERDTLVNLGAGIKRDLGSNWQFRTDVRAFNSLDNEYTDLAVTAGLALAFGKESKPAPAPAPIPVPVDVDSDGDGVLDSKDQCPNTVKGLKVDDVGCPVVLEKTLEINLEILFDTAKTEIKDEYLWQVQKLADALTQYQNTVVLVQGHTDSQGSDALNQKLSQGRADSVKAALITKFGIAPDRVTAKGYGESQPIADNNTAEGRAKNRRVVGAVSVKYTEEVKK